MSSEWHTLTFADAPFYIIDGDRGANYPKQYDFRSLGYCLFLNAGNVTDNGFSFSDCAFITQEKDSVLRKGKLVRHDLILTTRGTVGNVAYYSDAVEYQNIRINSGMVIFRPDITKIIPYYLYLFLRSRTFREQVAYLTSGSAQPQLPIRDMNRIEMPLPPLEVQQEICNLLGALDDRIALLRETNATLEAIAQALFKSWFVDFDPVHAKARGEAPQGMDDATAALFPDSFEESELGMIPKGWQVSKIEDLMELAYGKALKATDRISGPIPVYGSGGITGYHNKSLVDGASIIVGRKGTVGSLYWEDRPFFPIDTVFYVRTSKPLTYCYYLLKTLGLEDMNTDGAVPGLNRNNVYRLQFAFPSDDTLLAFNNIVSALRNRIYSNNEQAQTLAQLRDTLLPKLISGQLRLPEAEALLAEELP